MTLPLARLRCRHPPRVGRIFAALVLPPANQPADICPSTGAQCRRFGRGLLCCRHVSMINGSKQRFGRRRHVSVRAVDIEDVAEIAADRSSSHRPHPSGLGSLPPREGWAPSEAQSASLLWQIRLSSVSGSGWTCNDRSPSTFSQRPLRMLHAKEPLIKPLLAGDLSGEPAHPARPDSWWKTYRVRR